MCVYMQKGRGTERGRARGGSWGAREADGDLSKQITVNSMTLHRGDCSREGLGCFFQCVSLVRVHDRTAYETENIIMYTCYDRRNVICDTQGWCMPICSSTYMVYVTFKFTQPLTHHSRRVHVFRGWMSFLKELFSTKGWGSHLLR